MPAQWILNRTVKPTVEPVTQAELQNHARVVNADVGQSQALTDAIAIARDQFELLTDVAIMQQTWALQLQGLCRDQRLPKPPLQSVTSVQYLDTEGTLKTVDPSNYRVLVGGYSNGRIVFNPDFQTPADFGHRLAFPWTITFVCGETLPADVWSGVRGAILTLAAYLYEERVTAREGQIIDLPHAFNSVVSQYRVFWP